MWPRARRLQRPPRRRCPPPRAYRPPTFLRAHDESRAAVKRLWPSVSRQAHPLLLHRQPTQLPADAVQSARPTHPDSRPPPAPPRQIAPASLRRQTESAARSTQSTLESPICEIPPSTLVPSTLQRSVPEQNPIVTND